MTTHRMRTTALCVLLLTPLACVRDPPLLRMSDKLELLRGMEVRLLQAAEAEKSAVLALTDEESKALAAEAQARTAEVERMHARLTQLVRDGERPEEAKALAAFDKAWSDVKDVDRRLLTLAVANTNLKAARLAAKDASADLDRAVTALQELTKNSQDLAVVRMLSGAATAATRTLSLLLIHIPEAADAEMTALESRVEVQMAVVDAALRDAAPKLPDAAAQVQVAQTAWADYQKVTKEILRLSRLNTNVTSFDISVHEKRLVTRLCLEALADLRRAVESVHRPAR